MKYLILPIYNTERERGEPHYAIVELIETHDETAFVPHPARHFSEAIAHRHAARIAEARSKA